MSDISFNNQLKNLAFSKHYSNLGQSCISMALQNSNKIQTHFMSQLRGIQPMANLLGSQTRYANAI